MTKNKVFTQIGIVVGILLLVNLIAGNLYFRLDFTADQRYTLSDATKGVVEDLDEVVTVTAYFSEGLPPQLLNARKDFEDLLVEYEQRSGGNLVYEFVNPNESDQLEKEAQQKGIRPLMVNVTERDQVKKMRAYMGAVLQMGDQKEIISVVQSGASMEYALTTAIKKLAIEEKPQVAFLQGHGEASMSDCPQLQEQLSVLYETETFSLGDTSEIPSYYRSIAIVNPTDSFPPSHLNKLDRYLNNGGKLFVAFNNVKGDLRQGMLQAGNDIGLAGWLSRKGITVNKDFVIDANCGAVTVRQQQGPFSFNSQVEFPYFPVISKFAEHPVGQGLESMFLPFASSINIDLPDSSTVITPIAFTSDLAGTVTPPKYVDIQKEWAKDDFPKGNIVLSAAWEKGDGSMVVISNGDFIISQGQGQQRQDVNEDNVNFASNAIDWLSDDTGLIDLRTKGVTSRPLKQIEDSTKAILKYGNVVAPILLILIVGIIRRQQNNRKRQQWLEGRF